MNQASTPSFAPCLVALALACTCLQLPIAAGELITPPPGLQEAASLDPIGFRKNLRATLDLSSRVVAITNTDEVGYENAIGIDLHKVFSNADRDWGTLLVQLYAVRIDDLRRRPSFFDGENDWEILYKNTNFNFTGFGHGALNFKFGHMELPFGLEVPIDSNGTLRSLLNPRNLGVKADWGVGINGVTRGLGYDLVLSRGSGNNYETEGAPFVISGRIGNARGSDAFLPGDGMGLSVFYGEVFGRAGTTERLRVALDAHTTVGPFGLMGELGAGHDEDDLVIAGMTEVNWQNTDETFVLYLQGKALFQDFDHDWEGDVTFTSGLRFTPTARWAFSTQLERETQTRAPRRPDTILSLQARFRF